MAGDGPAVIGEKRVERIHADVEDVAYLPHNEPSSGEIDPSTF
jgi:hypothetical protein